MPKDGRKKYHPRKKNNTSFQKLIFFRVFFGSEKKKKKHPPIKKTRFRSRKTSSFATTGWWPRSLEVMDFFRGKSQRWWPLFSGGSDGRERREGAIPTQVLISKFLVGFFLFEVLGCFLVGTSEKKSSWNWKKVLRNKTKQLIFCMLSFFGRFFREIFLFVMFVLCFCGGDKERAAVYRPDTTRKPLGSWVNPLLFVH